MARRRWMAVVGLAAAGLAVAACAGSSGETSQGAVVPTSSASSVSSAAPATTVPAPTTTLTPATTLPPPNTIAPAPPPRAGAVRHEMKFGPIEVKPGQNSIDFAGPQVPKPPEDGWIVRIALNLVRADGTVPGVNVIHLHHGVWLNLARKDATAPQLPERIFAAGEEKTITTFPDGFGYPTKAGDQWGISFMVHNLLPADDQVWLTYDLDVIPLASAPAGMRAVRPIWLDVQNGEAYPVFDVERGTGSGGTFTYPDAATAPYGTGPPKNEWVVDADSTLVATAGHLHPGGLHTDLDVARTGEAAAARLFRSEAVYWEPAGPVSWDVAMTATPADWRVAVKAGDRLRVSATYDSATASWYESMGIMVVWAADGAAGAADPFAVAVDRAGEVTHGPLPENSVHGGDEAALPDAVALPGVPAPATIDIADWLYAVGDTSESATAIPEVKAGQSLTFVNQDAPLGNGIWHTVTACRAPCNRSTGIAYPLADADVPFDSGELGLGGPPTANRTTWSTPSDLAPGTYTYFCRIHPIMRGAFRVTPDA